MGSVLGVSWDRLTPLKGNSEIKTSCDLMSSMGNPGKYRTQGYGMAMKTQTPFNTMSTMPRQKWKMEHNLFFRSD